MGVLYANNASTTLASAITSTATSLSVASGKGALFPTISGEDFFYVTLSNGSGAVEIVKVTACSVDTFTVVRGQDGTAALAFAAGDVVDLRLTKAVLDAIKTDALTNPAITGGYTETVFTITGTAPSISPVNGTIQEWTLTGNSAPTYSDALFSSGRSVTLIISAGAAYTVSWTAMAIKWKTNGGTAPTLSTTQTTVVQLWKVGINLYGARVGDV